MIAQRQTHVDTRGATTPLRQPSAGEGLEDSLRRDPGEAWASYHQEAKGIRWIGANACRSEALFVAERIAVDWASTGGHERASPAE